MSLEREIREYLNQKNLTYKEVQSENGGEFNLRQCPLCKDSKDHAFLNKISGVFYCHICGEGCTFLSFKQRFKDIIPVQPMIPQETKVDMDLSIEVGKAHQALLASKKGMKYVWNRGFTKEAIEHFWLGYSVEADIPYLWYPYICEGRPINVKKRSIEGPKSFKRISGGKSVLFNGDVIKELRDSIIVLEGEADTVALWSAGITNVVGTTIGAKGVADEWISQLDKFQKISFIYDTDEEGQQGAYKFANRLGLERCYKVQLPPTIKDVNQFFMEGGDARQMLRKIELAKLFDVEYVSSIADQIKKGIAKWSITTQENEDRIHFPWKKLDYLTDGMMPGDLIIIASKPGVGKTEMALNILYELSKTEIPSLLFELEMRPERLMPRLVAKHLGKDSKHVFNTEDLTKAYSEMQNLRLFLAYVYKKPTFDQVADTVRQCVRRYGIRLVVFDNLHFLCRSLTDQTREVSVVVQSFKLLAEELAIPIIAIARPRKNMGRIITNLDLKDCVTGGTQIALDNSEFRPIKTLVEKKTERYKVRTYDTNRKIELESNASGVWDTGEKECYKIRTKKGYIVELSENSRVYNGVDWVKVKELKIGDKIMVDTTIRPTRKGVTFNTGITHLKKELIPWNKDRQIGHTYDHSKIKRKIMRSDFNQKMRILNPPIGEKLNNHGYVLIYRPEWPSALKKENHLKGYIQEHVYIMEQHIGRQLKDDERIHHLDGNKSNNLLDNLLICSNSEHKQIHDRENQFVHKLIQEGRVYYDQGNKEFRIR